MCKYCDMEKDINKYWSDYKDIYSFEEILKIYRERKAIESINITCPKKILEIGCGFTPLFNKYQNFDEYTIIEPGEEAFEFVKKNNLDNKKIKFINDFFENCYEKLNKQNYDYIISTGVLHETNTPEIFLKTIKKLSNKNTEVYLNVPNALSMHRVIAKEMGLIESIYQQTERNILLKQNMIFDRESLTNLIKNVIPRVNILDCNSFFLKPFTHSQMMDCIHNKVLNENIFDGMYKASEYYPDSGCELYCRFNNITA